MTYLVLSGTLNLNSISVGTICCVSGMFNSPGMQSMMQQMMSNPQLMQSLMQSPYLQSTMQSLSSNPEMARQVCNRSTVVVQFSVNQGLRITS